MSKKAGGVTLSPVTVGNDGVDVRPGPARQDKTRRSETDGVAAPLPAGCGPATTGDYRSGYDIRR